MARLGSGHGASSTVCKGGAVRAWSGLALEHTCRFDWQNGRGTQQ